VFKRKGVSHLQSPRSLRNGNRHGVAGHNLWLRAVVAVVVVVNITGELLSIHYTTG